MSTVFISYVHEDAQFARSLAAALRSAGVEPWLYEHRNNPGDPLEETLHAAIARAECGVFLVAPRFAKSDYCMNELRIFAEHFSHLRRIPVLRRPRKELEIPALLGARLVAMEWIDGVTNCDEAIYELLCAIRGEKVKPDRVQWAALGRAATASMPAEFLAPPADPYVTSAQYESLRCDRAREWMAFEDIYPGPSHHVVLLGGTPADAHDYFVVRIERYLRVQPAFERAQVDWRLRPRTKGECFERLDRALQHAGPSGLVARLRYWMREKNLILIHLPIEDRYEDPILVSYYREWLPELMDEVKPVRRLKCIQPVVWTSPPRVAAALRQWFGGTPPQWLLSGAEKNGRALIERMEAIPSASTLTEFIELGPIHETDVRQFCRTARLAPVDTETLLDEIRDRRITTPRALIDHIDQFIRVRQPPA